MDYEKTKILHKKTNGKKIVFTEIVRINIELNTINLRLDIENLTRVYSYLLNLHSTIYHFIFIALFY